MYSMCLHVCNKNIEIINVAFFSPLFCMYHERPGTEGPFGLLSIPEREIDVKIRSLSIHEVERIVDQFLRLE